LEKHDIRYNELSTTPTILNAFLWSGIAINSDTLYIGEYSIFQDDENVNWIPFARNLHLMDHPAKKELSILHWFSQGKYFVTEDGDTLQFYNAKWGRSNFRSADPDKAFFFHYSIYNNAGRWVAASVEPEFDGSMKEAFKDLWKRVFNARVEKM
jgi:hypothetical protein